MALSLKLAARFSPRQPRIAVEIDATLLMPNDCVEPLTIKNISCDGFMGATEADLDVGQWIGIELPTGGIVPAQVRWVLEGEIGARFRRPFDLDWLSGKELEVTDARPLFLSRLLSRWR